MLLVEYLLCVGVWIFVFFWGLDIYCVLGLFSVLRRFFCSGIIEVGCRVRRRGWRSRFFNLCLFFIRVEIVVFVL